MTSTTSESVQGAPVDLIGGHYRVVRTLGKGGMGTVYEAENTWTKRHVAVKVMRPEVARDGELASRFMQEARATARLAHPNIIDVLDMGQDKELGALYIVEEFLSGHDLRVHMNVVGKIAPREALEIILPVMEALTEAHAHGIVHRDLKPDNIFLAETSRGIVPTLIDFGVAKIAPSESDEASLKTRAGMLMGTPSYMSPEQGRGEATLDGRADVWSLGVVLYEMLTGTRPHDALTPIGLIAQIIYQDPRPLAEVAPELPAGLSDAVMGALQRDITRRYPTMQAFHDALKSCDLTRGAVSSAPRVESPEESAVVLPTHRSWRSAWLALIAALGLGGLLLLATLMHGGEHRVDPPSRPVATATTLPRAPIAPPPVAPPPVAPAPVRVIAAPPARSTPPPPAAVVTTRRTPPRAARARPATAVMDETLPPQASEVTTGVPVIE